VGVVDRNPKVYPWHCQDCGAEVDRERFKEVARNASAPHSFDVTDAADLAVTMVMPGACPSCGGGRLVCGTGTHANAEIIGYIRRPGRWKN